MSMIRLGLTPKTVSKLPFKCPLGALQMLPHDDFFETPDFFNFFRPKTFGNVQLSRFYRNKRLDREHTRV